MVTYRDLPIAACLEYYEFRRGGITCLERGGRVYSSRAGASVPYNPYKLATISWFFYRALAPARYHKI